jgi:hypothetical protein
MTKKIEINNKPKDKDKKAERTDTKKTSIDITRKQGLFALGLLLIIVLTVGSLHYVKSHQTSPHPGQFGRNAPDGSGDPSGRMGGRNGAMRGGVFGQVTTVSATSITIKNARTGADNTLTISDSTIVTNNGQTATVSDVKTGDNVLVRPDTTDTKQAAQITLNPQMPGRGAMGGGGSSQPQADPQVPVQSN